MKSDRRDRFGRHARSSARKLVLAVAVAVTAETGKLAWNALFGLAFGPDRLLFAIALPVAAALATFAVTGAVWAARPLLATPAAGSKPAATRSRRPTRANAPTHARSH